jgi:cytoskeleton-associated protein 5
LPKIFAHSDKTVRAEGTLLTHVLYQYLGPGIEPWLADLKPVQVKELKEAFDAMEAGGTGKGTVKPERLTRAHAREVEAAGDGGEEAAVESEEEAGERLALSVRFYIEFLMQLRWIPLASWNPSTLNFFRLCKHC